MDVYNVRTLLRLLALVVAVRFAGPLEAQQAFGTIGGQVTDAVTLRPLQAAQLSVTGTSRGSLANGVGQYLILNVPVGTQTVRVDLIGYATVEQAVSVVAGQIATLDFRLSLQALQLDRIVVTGTAGRTQRRSIGNSVSKFEAADITEEIPVRSLQELLQARTPGLTILSNGGGAGDGSQIRLRGAGSLEGRFEPVIYVDGLRIESGNLGGAGGTARGTANQCGTTIHCTNALDYLNPNDIESIEVIRGPAAATLYGADAAGGVIQVITKKGRPGEGIQWSVNFDGGLTNWNLDRPQTFWRCTESNINDPARFPGCQGMSANTVLTDSPMERHPNAIRGNDGSIDSNGAGEWSWNVSARGGGERFNYFLSGEQTKEQGILLNNFSDRTGGRANFGFTPSDEFNFNVNVSYVRSEIQQPLSNNSSNSITRNAYRGRAQATNDPWEQGFRGFGPELSNQWDQLSTSERFTLGATVNYSPRSWFTNRLVLGLDNNDRRVDDFTQIDQTGLRPWGTSRSDGFIDITLPNTETWTVDYAGTLSADVSETLNSSFSAGVQLNATEFQTFRTTGEGLVASNLNLVGLAATTRASQGFSEQTSLGFYVQEQVGWKDRLYATAAVRVDDNSAFGRDFSLVVYPKAQLSYVISDEGYFSVSWIDQLKLRGAWGQAGNPPDPFVADRTFTADVTTVGDEVVSGLVPSSFGNPDLKAETGSEIELGFESSLFNGRVGLDFTYYNQSTKDALIAVPAPRSSGFNGDFFDNVGEISNEGIELLVTATPIYIPNLQWDATLSFSTNSNELVDFGDAPLEEISFGSFGQVQKHIEGFPMGGFWSTDVVRDAGGAPVLDTNGNVTLESDKEFVGPSLPTREIGFTNSFTLFGDFRVYTNLDYKGGHYQWCAICSVRSRIDQNTQTLNDPNTDDVTRAVLTSRQTKTWIEQADFVKLREVAVTYQLPPTVAQSFRFDGASVTLSGRNLWLWTKYEFDQDGLGSPDPEVNFNSVARFNRTDYSSIPMLRTFSASLRFTF